jgi:hypothetical protein
VWNEPNYSVLLITKPDGTNVVGELTPKEEKERWQSEMLPKNAKQRVITPQLCCGCEVSSMTTDFHWFMGIEERRRQRCIARNTRRSFTRVILASAQTGDILA